MKTQPDAAKDTIGIRAIGIRILQMIQRLHQDQTKILGTLERLTKEVEGLDKRLQKFEGATRGRSKEAGARRGKARGKIS